MTMLAVDGPTMTPPPPTPARLEVEARLELAGITYGYLIGIADEWRWTDDADDLLSEVTRATGLIMLVPIGA